MKRKFWNWVRNEGERTLFLNGETSYSYRDNKKIDETSRTNVLLFLFLVKCQHLTIC